MKASSSFVRCGVVARYRSYTLWRICWASAPGGVAAGTVEELEAAAGVAGVDFVRLLGVALPAEGREGVEAWEVAGVTARLGAMVANGFIWGWRGGRGRGADGESRKGWDVVR